jgi:hypothetical protein
MDLVIKALGLDKVTFLFEVGIMGLRILWTRLQKAVVRTGCESNLLLKPPEMVGRSHGKTAETGQLSIWLVVVR